jgi:hypothetical protein
MRLLLDECLDDRLRHSFPDHDCQTARYAKLAGFKNGNVTVDQNIESQQNLAGRKIALLALCAPTNRRRDLERLIPFALAGLRDIQRGQIVRIT